jgi:ubiquinone biosynthesis protein UbiJ
MPTKNQRSKLPTPPWEVILEEIRSQNRATIEAVEASRASLEQRIERLERDTHTRDATLEMAIRELRLTVQQNGIDICGLQGDVRGLQGDVRGLAAKVDALAHLEERVAALEKRLAS